MKTFESKADSAERWYGTKYHVGKICVDLINKWSNVSRSEEHFLPPKNEFIATNFDIVPSPPNEELNKLPYLLKV